MTTTYTFDNFFNSTIVVFSETTRPSREADYVSHKFGQPNAISSEYWYGEDEGGEYVVRGSNHWSSCERTSTVDSRWVRASTPIASCRWFIRPLEWVADSESKYNAMTAGLVARISADAKHFSYAKAYLKDFAHFDEHNF